MLNSSVRLALGARPSFLQGATGAALQGLDEGGGAERAAAALAAPQGLGLIRAAVQKGAKESSRYRWPYRPQEPARA
jgi:hypothetical protein